MKQIKIGLQMLITAMFLIRLGFRVHSLLGDSEK
jgi:hypothetical protein